jgi:hypothetical protein
MISPFDVNNNYLKYIVFDGWRRCRFSRLTGLFGLKRKVLTVRLIAWLNEAAIAAGKIEPKHV